MIATHNSDNAYSIESYDPLWIEKFASLKKMLHEVFGDKALAIEHVGSTAVPGMKAKPFVDVLVTVEKVESFDREKELLGKRGYEWKENYVAPDTLFFYVLQGSKKIENIHVCAKSSDQAARLLNMRDYLRAHPDKSAEYVHLKENLNKKFPDDYAAYRAGKRDFLEEINMLARDWRESLQK